MRDRGCLFVLSGPSGSGKDTILKEYLAGHPEVKFSISSITRPMRPGEQEGDKYHFIPREEFERLIGQGEMLEYAEYCGNYYGTPRRPIEQWLEQGFTVLVEVDVQGADQIHALMPEAVRLFVMPPSMEVLRRRLLGRKTESDEVARARLREAAREIARAKEYDYIVINDVLEDAVASMTGIIESEKVRVPRMIPWINEVLNDAESFDR